MSRETTKATIRRFKEADAGLFQWREIFKGKGIDIGSGDNPLSEYLPDVTPFDLPQDANRLSSYYPLNTFSWANSSHSLEHMADPEAALSDWLVVVKPGGYIIVEVPDLGAYERFTYPSRHNADHRSSWSMIYKGSPFPIHCHIPTFLERFKDIAEIKLMRYVEENYDWKLPPEVDQTWEPENGVEIWNEFVLKKL